MMFNFYGWRINIFSSVQELQEIAAFISNEKRIDENDVLRRLLGRQSKCKEWAVVE